MPNQRTRIGTIATLGIALNPDQQWIEAFVHERRISDRDTEKHSADDGQPKAEQGAQQRPRGMIEDRSGVFDHRERDRARRRQDEARIRNSWQTSSQPASMANATSQGIRVMSCRRENASITPA